MPFFTAATAAMLLCSGLRGGPLLARTYLRRSASSAASGAPTPRRLLLTSSGLTTPQLEASFQRMLKRAADGGAGSASIAMLVTAQLAPSTSRVTQRDDDGGALVVQPSSKRSPGELRQRRWADACKKGRELQARLGVPVKCIDCTREQALNDARSALSQAGCIWVTGGNTFFLWHSMRASGLSELVRQRVNDEGALYVGASAGSIVAGRTIRTALWKGWDDPEAAGPEADWEADGAYDALGLVEDVSFFPHYDAASWGGLVDRQRRSLGHACVVLADDGSEVYVEGDS